MEGSLLGAYKASTLPSGLDGDYTVVIPAVSGTDPMLPSGPGYGTMTMAKTGAVHIAGKLGDGTPFSAGGQLNADGRTWTVFELLYAGKHPGSISGMMTFESGTDTLQRVQVSGSRVPTWRGNIQADKEKVACRADRRKA